MAARDERCCHLRRMRWSGRHRAVAFDLYVGGDRSARLFVTDRNSCTRSSDSSAISAPRAASSSRSASCSWSSPGSHWSAEPSPEGAPGKAPRSDLMVVIATGVVCARPWHQTLSRRHAPRSHQRRQEPDRRIRERRREPAASTSESRCPITDPGTRSRRRSSPARGRLRSRGRDRAPHRARRGAR